MSLPQFWTLVGFGETFDAWVAQESPSKDLQRTVGEWIVSRYEDPYQGVQRQYAIAPNLNPLTTSIGTYVQYSWLRFWAQFAPFTRGRGVT